MDLGEDFLQPAYITKSIPQPTHFNPSTLIQLPFNDEDFFTIHSTVGFIKDIVT
jgi:hypothetical protein